MIEGTGVLAVALLVFTILGKATFDVVDTEGAGNQLRGFDVVGGREPLGTLFPHLALLVGTVTHYANAADSLMKARVVLAITYLASGYWQVGI